MHPLALVRIPHHAEVFLLKNVSSTKAVWTATGYAAFDHHCDEPVTVYFVDLHPMANWAHPCLYIASTGTTTIVKEASWPPCDDIEKVEVVPTEACASKKS